MDTRSSIAAKLASVPVLGPYMEFLARNRAFLILWLATFISQIGDWLDELAVIIILNKYYSSGTLLSLLLIVRELPPSLLSPPAGVVADTYDKRWVMLVCDLLRAGVVLCFLFVRSKAAIPVLYVVCFLQLSISAFFSPAKSSLIPALVPPEDVLIANSVDQLTWSVILFLGAAIGGFVANFFGTDVSFIADSATYVGSGILTYRLLAYRLLEPPRDETSPLPAQNSSNKSLVSSLWASLAGSIRMFRDGMKYLWCEKYIFVIAHAKALGALVWSGQELLYLRFAADVFPLGQDGALSFGILYAAMGFGTAVAPLTLQKLFPDTLVHNEYCILIGTLLQLIGSYLMAWSPNFVVFVLVNMIRSSGSGTLWVFSSSILMREVRAEVRGRVFAYEMGVLTLVSVTVKFVGGLLLDHTSIGIYNLTLVTALLAVAASCFWILFIFFFFNPRQQKTEHAGEYDRITLQESNGTTIEFEDTAAPME